MSKLKVDLTLKGTTKLEECYDIWEPLLAWLEENSLIPESVDEEHDFIAWHAIHGEKPVWLEVIDEDFVVNANTRQGGPGYHAWLCDSMRKLAKDLDVKWVEVSDSTGYWSSGNQADLNKLKYKPLFDLSSTYPYPHVIWPEIGVSASIFVEQAKALMHRLCWAPPLTEHEQYLMESIDRLLNHAREMDPKILVPAGEWVEVKALLGQDGEVDLVIEAAEQSGVLIGYKREPFSYAVGGKLHCHLDANTHLGGHDGREQTLVSENGSIRIRIFQEGAENYPMGVLPGKPIAVPFTIGSGIGAIESLGKKKVVRTISICRNHVIKTEITSEIPEAEAWCLEKLKGMSFGLGPKFPVN